jgi:hypothetical protein
MDQPVRQDAQVVRPQRLAGGGDVGNRLGGSVLDRALGRALAVDQLVIRHPLRLQEIADQPVILGGDPQPVAMRRAKARCRRVQVIHGFHVDPDVRHRDDQVGMAEAQPLPVPPLRAQHPPGASRTRSDPVTPR